jgi:hypothetical protein
VPALQYEGLARSANLFLQKKSRAAACAAAPFAFAHFAAVARAVPFCVRALEFQPGHREEGT